MRDAANSAEHRPSSAQSGAKKMNLTKRDEHRLRVSCVRSALVMIVHELDRILSTPDLRAWCSEATIGLLNNSMQAKKESRITRDVVMFARRAAQLGSSMTWGESASDA